MLAQQFGSAIFFSLKLRCTVSVFQQAAVRLSSFAKQIKQD